MGDTQPIISVQKISKRFPGVVALEDVSLDIVPGELHSICGENGAGKSTLMKILSGVIPDFEGELLLAGKPVRFTRCRIGWHQHHPSGIEPGGAAFGSGEYLFGTGNPRLFWSAGRSGDG